MQIVDWLNENQGAIIAITTLAALAIANFILVGVTIYYAGLVRRQLKAADTPEIAVYLEMKENGMYLSITNIGTGIARDLQFEMDLSLDSYRPGFLDGISYLEYGRPMRYFLCSERMLSVFFVSVTYEDSTGEKYERSFSLDPIMLDGAVDNDDKFYSLSQKLRGTKNNIV